MLYISVVTEASTSCPSAHLGPCFLQKAGPEVAPENSFPGIPSGPGESQLWAEEGMCDVILVAEGLLSV